MNTMINGLPTFSLHQRTYILKCILLKALFERQKDVYPSAGSAAERKVVLMHTLIFEQHTSPAQ